MGDASLWSCIGLGWIPFFGSSFIIVGILGSYAASVTRGIVTPTFPYISESGYFPPGSCILAQFFNLAAAFYAALFYVRYKMLRGFFERSNKSVNLRRTSLAALFVGLLGALGLSLVGNFQGINVPVVHLLGALLGIIVGGIYLWIDTVLSGYTTRSTSGRPLVTKGVVYFRVFVCLVETSGYVGYQAANVISSNAFDGINRLKWAPTDAGYGTHLVATISEWIAVLALAVYVLTLVPEFSRVRWEATAVPRDTDTRQQPAAAAAASDGQAEQITNPPVTGFSPCYPTRAELCAAAAGGGGATFIDQNAGAYQQCRYPPRIVYCNGRAQNFAQPQHYVPYNGLYKFY